MSISCLITFTRNVRARGGGLRLEFSNAELMELYGFTRFSARSTTFRFNSKAIVARTTTAVDALRSASHNYLGSHA